MRKHNCKTVVSIALTLAMVFSCGVGLMCASYAVGYETLNVVESRGYDYLVCTQTTPLYTYLPYSEGHINNPIKFNLAPGDKMNIRGYKADIYGNMWWYVNVFYSSSAPNLTPTTGYVSADHVESVYEGP